MSDMLIYGIGNPARGDDGIGPYCVQAINQQLSRISLPFRVTAQAIYHLTIDNLSEAVGFAQIIIFDATMAHDVANFTCQQIIPQARQQFTTHLLTPEEFLFSLQKLFDCHPAMHLFSIKGYAWDLTDNLSPRAKINADKAIKFFLKNFIHNARS
jgi:hydrogenase maturation protease